mgnify:CR=1 FL=1
MKLHLPVVIFLLVFIVLSVIQYLDFSRPSLETFGYKEWRLNGVGGFRDSSLAPVGEEYDGFRPVRFNVSVIVRLEGNGYTVTSGDGVEILRARFSGRSVEWYSWSRDEYVFVGFSPFLVIWPTKPKPILMHLALRQVDIWYLGSKQVVDFDWIIREESLLHLPDGTVIPIRRVGVLVLSTPLEYIEVNSTVGEARISSQEPFRWFLVEYKGSLPISMYIVIPVEFINKEYLAKLGFSEDMLEVAEYVEFILSIEGAEDLRVIGGSGLLYFLYPVIGGVLSGVVGVAYLWASRRF